MSETSIITKYGRSGIIVAAVLIAALIPPMYLDVSKLQLGLFVFSAAVSAIGLTLLSGTAGQLSLGHAFFVGFGAYAYVYLSSDTDGLGLPTAAAAVVAVLLTALAGLAFSPVSARIRGLYLGVASLALVYLGQHLITNLTSVTGGYEGREVPTLSIAGLDFSKESTFALGGVRFGQYEMLWALGVIVLALVAWFARGIIRGRQGRALAVIRDSETAAAAMGVDVGRSKMAIFALSSAIAGLGGVLYALTASWIVPESFGLALSINFLAMVVIGGLGTIGGAVIGAALVAGLPLLLAEFAGSLPIFSEDGSGALTPTGLAQYVYGALVVALVLIEPDGLSGLSRRLRARSRRRANPSSGADDQDTAATGEPSQPQTLSN